MRRVLHVISGLGIGGAEMTLYRLVSNSPHGEYQHTVVSLTSELAMGQRFRDAGIELITFDFRRSPILHFFSLLSLIRKSRPDIVQTWMYHADMIGGLAARLAGNRNVIWGIRTTGTQAGGLCTTVRVRQVRQICAWLSRWVPHTIVCAAEASRTAHVAYGYDPTRMVVVPNGFDLSWTATADQRAILRAQCGFGATDVVIGSLARFHPVKDPENFVRAACLLAQKHECVRFMMVGRNMDAGNVELARWIAGTGYANRFVLLGERADVPACLKSMDIFCLHSRTEGFPNAVGEAMVMGLPCIVTDVGDAALLVADRSMVVPKEDSRALAHALERLLTMEPEARCRLGREAKARIQADFTIRRTRERFEQVYANVFASCKLID